MNLSRVTLKKSKNRVFEKYIFGPQQGGGYLLGRGYLPRIERYLYLVFLLKKRLKKQMLSITILYCKLRHLF